MSSLSKNSGSSSLTGHKHTYNLHVHFCLYLTNTCYHNWNGAEEKLSDIVGSAYYVAPEVLHRSYGIEADMWSIGVIAYILLCGSRPFWARTESGIFRAVLKAKPSLEEEPWPYLSAEARDFIKQLLNKDYRRRLTASQALCKLAHVSRYQCRLVAISHMLKAGSTLMFQVILGFEIVGMSRFL